MIAVQDKGWSRKGLAFFVGLGVRLTCLGAKLGTGSIGLTDRVKLNMKKTIEVYTWATLASFVRKACNFQENQNSNEVLDVLAKDLRTGDLQRRDTSGYPIEPWKHILDLGKSYLIPAEVNARPVMKKWLLEWNPERDNKLTPQEEVDKYGWLGALKLEEGRHRALLKAGGIRFHITQRAEHLHAYAVKHNITTRRGEIPSVGTIRNAVFYRKTP